MQGIMVSQLCFIIAYKPWRVPVANHLDVIFTSAVLFITCVASLYVNEERSDSLAYGVVVLCIILFLMLPASGIWCLYKQRQGKRSKPFRYYICHHKAVAGSFARLLKMELPKKSDTSGDVLIGTDTMLDQEGILEILASQVQTVLLVNSQGVFRQLSCVAELVVSMQRNVEGISLTLPGVREPSSDFIDNYKACVGDISTLTSSAIGINHVQDAIKWACTLRSVEVPLALDDAQMRSIVESCSAKGEPPAAPQDERSDAAGKPCNFIVRDEQNLEATCNAMILVRLLSFMLADKPGAIPKVLKFGQELPDTATKAILICTSSAMQQQSVLSTLTAGVGAHVSFLPVLSDEGFRFPTTTSEAKSGPARATVVNDSIGDIFQTLALPFQSGVVTQEALEGQARVIADWLADGPEPGKPEPKESLPEEPKESLQEDPEEHAPKESGEPETNEQ